MSDIERLYKILDSQISKRSVNLDFNLNIGIGQSNRILPLNEINSVVSQSEVFDQERDDSEKYIFLGSISQVISNVLINITGNDSYETVTTIANVTELNSVNEIIDEKDGWFFYSKEDCKNTEFRPYKSDLLLLSENIKDNWTLDITYPYTGVSDTVYFNANNNPSYPVYIKDGIAINSVQNVTIGGQLMTQIETPINHKLVEGDLIRIYGGTIYDGEHEVYKLGDEQNTRLNNVFVINVNFTLPTIQNTYARFKRIVNNTPSEYILRHFKKITNPNDIDFYYASFSKTYFSDDVICYNTNSEIDLSKYQDYLGRPITEVYLSIVKNKTGPNDLFLGDLKAGLNVAVQNANYDIRQINDCGSNGVIDLGIVNSSDNVFLGDIIDYNSGDITERVLCEINHRFNTDNRNQNNYCEGYFYSPHKKIQVKYYSNYLEYSATDMPTTNIPYYALQSNLRYRWRDILTKGYKDETNRGVDYPFLNGINYISNNFFLPLKRQDPELNYVHGKNPIFIGIPCNISALETVFQNVC
jgi:hypothetical protein